MNTEAVIRVAMALYFAGNWTCDDLTVKASEDLWRELRVALGIPPGTSTLVANARSGND